VVKVFAVGFANCCFSAPFVVKALPLVLPIAIGSYLPIAAFLRHLCLKPLPLVLPLVLQLILQLVLPIA
jgi:hypothetical protein